MRAFRFSFLTVAGPRRLLTGFPIKSQRNHSAQQRLELRFDTYFMLYSTWSVVTIHLSFHFVYSFPHVKRVDTRAYRTPVPA